MDATFDRPLNSTQTPITSRHDQPNHSTLTLRQSPRPSPKMDDLFDSFTAKPPKPGSAPAIRPPGPTPKKRLASPNPPPTESESAKKAKTVNPVASTSTAPVPPPITAVATDEFESDVTTEVKGSVGLGGGTAEGLVLSHAVRHQVALPPHYPYVPIASHVPPAEPARTYPFELDPFQKVSVASIQRNESVLVSAHTSAGKTVVAEYAIAQCLKQGQRVVYTSPIKVSCRCRPRCEWRVRRSAFADRSLVPHAGFVEPKVS